MKFIFINQQPELKNFLEEVAIWYTEAMYHAHEYKNKEDARRVADQAIAELLKSDDVHSIFKLCIEEEQNRAGYIWFYVKPTEQQARLAYIGIDPPYRGKGYARQAIQEAEKRILNEYSSIKMTLNVFTHMPYAKRLYESLGYQVIETKNGRNEMEKLLQR